MSTTLTRVRSKPDKEGMDNGNGGEIYVPKLATVPDVQFAEEYISRKIAGMGDFAVFDMALNNMMNILIEGPTGPGKTSATMAWCATRQRRFYAIPSNVGVEPSQMFGKQVPDALRRWWSFHNGPVTDIVENGGCLLINEVNFLPERVATVLFPLMDKRREIMLLDKSGEVIRAHRPPVLDGRGRTVRHCWCPRGNNCPEERWVLIVADMNPEYEGTRPLNRAFRNRFAIQLGWDYDAEVEKQLVDSEILLQIAQGIRADSSADFSTPVATNMLQEFERLVTTAGLDFAILNFIQHFGVDERSAIQDVFLHRRKDLEESFAAPVDDGFNDVFSYEQSKWAVTPTGRLRH